MLLIIFRCHGDGDATVFDFVAPAYTRWRAEEYIKKLEKERLALVRPGRFDEVQCAHKSMKEANNWIYYGNRADCHSNVSRRFGGYVIEEVEIL